eukprot:23525-Chlamydomonas_euryale.AAC.14
MFWCRPTTHPHNPPRRLPVPAAYFLALPHTHRATTSSTLRSLPPTRLPPPNTHTHTHKQGDHEFYSEVGLLTRLRHPNLVCMMGMCDEAGKKLGVFEYMPRGSLRELLDRRQLSWADRMDIAVGGWR